jgi:hypothetical protein
MARLKWRREPLCIQNQDLFDRAPEEELEKREIEKLF